ncbi:MAG: helix-turn-helix domain-containing protein [Acidimicrobiales bacterium]|nr:helix-turn-helix domain-containing protein [Acidimicrobiales bacterium]
MPPAARTSRSQPPASNEDWRPPAKDGAGARGPSPPTVASLAAEALTDLPEMTERLLFLTLEVEEPYHRIDPDEFRQYARENLGRTLTDLSEGAPIGIESQRETARRRAEEGVPLASVLHAFRIGFSVIWEAMLRHAERFGEPGLRALLEGAGTLWAIIDRHSEVVTTEYGDALVDLARRDQERRLLLIDALFDGRLAEWHQLHGSLRDLGLPGRGMFVAVSAETPEPGADALAGVEGVLAREGWRSVWRLRADEQVGVVALGTKGSSAALRDVLSPMASGRVGLSSEYDDPVETPAALGSAALGRDCLPPGSAGITTAEENVVTSLVVGSPELSARVARLVLGPLLRLGARERQRLLSTLATWFDTGGDPVATGAALCCHRNTVRNRLATIERLSGRLLREPRGLAELYLATRILQLDERVH